MTYSDRKCPYQMGDQLGSQVLYMLNKPPVKGKADLWDLFPVDLVCFNFHLSIPLIFMTGFVFFPPFSALGSKDG